MGGSAHHPNLLFQHKAGFLFDDTGDVLGHRQHVGAAQADDRHRPPDNAGRDVMLDAPSVLEPKQLDELKLVVKE